jgi:hypothetical protein
VTGRCRQSAPSEIFYTVWDPVNLVSYTRDTGITVLEFLADPSQSFSFAH